MTKPSKGTASAQRKLTVGLVLDDTLDTPDGVQQYVLHMGEWLQRQGHSVRYLVGQTTRTDLANVHSLSRNVKVRFNQNRMSIPLPTSPRRLKALLKAENIDVLHVQMPYSPMLGARLVQAASPQTAVVGTFHIAPHSWLVHHANRVLAVVLYRSRRRFDSIVSVSPAAQAFARRTFHITSDVLPNVFDYQRFHEAKGWPRYDDKTVTIMFFGRLVPRKGCQLLLEAAAALRHQPGLPKFRVLVCGKGPLGTQLRRYADSHGLGDIVEFTGFVSEADKPRYYASADITVFPSTGGESFGIVLLEAMAGGHAAVLAGDNPGYRSVLSDRPDLLFDPRDADALADKIAALLTDRAARRNVQSWGAGFAAAFDTGIVGPKMVHIYEQALRKRRGA